MCIPHMLAVLANERILLAARMIVPSSVQITLSCLCLSIARLLIHMNLTVPTVIVFAVLWYKAQGRWRDNVTCRDEQG